MKKLCEMHIISFSFRNYHSLQEIRIKMDPQLETI